MAWTKQQENAINARDSSIIVSAAAGSGKTSVLTERLVCILADRTSGVSADRMIVVTFTKDAAAELKTRLDAKLRELINEDPSNDHLLKQQILLQGAKISTINSFCFELLRDNIGDQGITSGFGILDENENNVIRSQAMDDLFAYYSENEYDKLSFIYDRFCIKSERTLMNVIERADKFLGSVALRDKWLEKAENEYKKSFKDTIYYSALMKSITERSAAVLKLADECLSMIGKIFSGSEHTPHAKKSLALAEEDYDRISRLDSIYRSGCFPSEKEAAELSAFSNLVKITSKTSHDIELRDIYKNKRNRMKELVISLINSTLTVESDFEESKQVTFILTEMIRKYNELIWQKKCAKNAISFDDGERLAIELLADIDESGRIVQSETAVMTANYYDMIMIDEYQDSNNKQDLIFKLISRNFKHTPEGEPMYGDNAFVVGDVKQSIYRFRLANPQNFIDTLRYSDDYSENSKSSNKAVYLNKNFRSSLGVIYFVNFVFGQVMTEKCGDVDYDEKEMLYYGAEKYSDFDLPYKTQINLINVDREEDETEAAGVIAKKREAVFTAKKIADMINTGALVLDKDGRTRVCKPSDFCILVRTNTDKNYYADALEKSGIPAKRGEESGYLKSREIAVLIDLLRVINNPLLDIPVMGVMTSPMYMFTVPEIALIKSIDKEKQLYPLISETVSGEHSDIISAELAERCRSFLDDMAHFRLKAVTMTIGELISAIYENTDFVSVMQLTKDGEKKRANLRLLIQYAHNFESSSAYEGTGGLCGFLRYIDRITENGDFVQGKASSASGDYVAIHTFHGSKGLEFPFVFIAETSHNFQSDPKTVMCSSDGMIGYTLYDPELVRHYRTFQITMLSEKEKQNTRSEEMRLLYVGMTRARQQLFINLKIGEKAVKHIKANADLCIAENGEIDDIVCEANTFADWIWAALMRHKKLAETADMLEISLPSHRFEDDLFDIEFADIKNDLSDNESYYEDEEFPADEDICRELNDIINDQYDRTLSKMSSKLSVTQITRKFKGDDGEFDFRLKRPGFISQSGKLSGAERGTAIHTFFQYCIFENAETDIVAELERMLEMGFLTKAQADVIDLETASAFFRSGLYNRLKTAKRSWREKKFMVAVAHLDIENSLMDQLKKSDGMIKGIIDLMFEEDDGIVLVDYKSDRNSSESELARRYAVQLELYRSAIELTMKKKVKEAYLYSIELKKQIPVIL